MPTTDGEWRVLPHGPIEKLASNLWRVWGSVPHATLRRVMTVARMTDGRLVIHSAVAMDEPSMTELETWGRPAFLLVPSPYHRLDAPAYKRRYPEMRVYAPRGSRAKVETRVVVDGTYDEFVGDDTVRLERLAGVGDMEGVMLVKSADGTTVVVNDAVFNMDRKKDVLGFVFTTLLGSAPGPRVSRLFKAAAVKDKKALRADLERLAAIPDLVRLIVAHEKVASGADAAAALRKAAGYL